MAQQWSLTEPVPQPVPRGKGAIVSGLVLLLVGVVCVVVGIAGSVSTVANLFADVGSPRTTPTEFTQTLDAGTTYAVYEQVTSGSGTSGDPYLGRVNSGDVTVTAPDGSSVAVSEAPSYSQTYTNNARTFVVVATFDPPVSGAYDIAVSTAGATVVVAPSVTSLVRSLPWLVLIGLGVLVGLVGLVVLIVGLVRRSSSRRPPAAIPGYAGTAYPAPGGPAPGYPASGAGGPAPGYPAPGAGAPAYPAPGAGAPAYPAPGAGAPAYPAPEGATPGAGYGGASPGPEYVAPGPGPAPVLPPAGWYPDPERPDVRRYWDGTAWTEHRA